MVRRVDYIGNLCNNTWTTVVKYKLITFFLLFILTPIIILPLSLHSLEKNAFFFTTMLILILYFIYLNIYFASKNYKIAIILVFILSFILKIFIASQLFGTADMESWYIIAGIMKKGITTNFYAETYRYNYSPMWAIMIYASDQLSKIISIPLSTLLKFPLIIFDVFTAFLIYKITQRDSKVKKTEREKESFRAVASFLYNPLIIMVTSYGAQFDTIAIYLLLLYYYLSSKGEIIWNHFIYGLSIAVKQVTVFPIVFFMLRQKGLKKMLFIFISAFPFLAIITPYLSGAFEGIMLNVIGNAGVPGFWGYSRAVRYITQRFWGNEIDEIVIFYMLKIMAVVLFVAMFYYFKKFKKISLLEGIIMSYLLFFALTPGFAVHYLVWILPFAIFQKDYFYYVYSILASLVTFLFYYGHGTSNLIIREILAFSVVGPFLWIFCIYWLFKKHFEIKMRHSIE